MIATPYEDLLRDVMENGTHRPDRTGTGTRSVFGRQLRYDLSQGFPLITTKRVHMKSIAYELLWFLRGDSNVKWLQDNGVTIWDEWADENGNLGPVYGYQWRSWPAPTRCGRAGWRRACRWAASWSTWIAAPCRTHLAAAARWLEPAVTSKTSFPS